MPTIPTLALIALALTAVAFLGGCAFVANRFYVPPEVELAETFGATDATAGEVLSIATWNIGYAGMGREADFFMDGGTQKRPQDAGLVDRNLTAIAGYLSRSQSDVLLLQEVARPSWNTHGRDVLAAVVQALPGRLYTFGADVETRQVPPPFRVSVGNAIFSSFDVVGVERRGLPLEPTFEFGAFRKGYRIHVLRLAGPENWVIANIHLSTFDSEEVNVRERQVAAVMDFARAEFEKGNRVVVGGDWNLRLRDTDFPDTTDPADKFWVRDFPNDQLAPGWQMAADPQTPTVRGAHQPYVDGDNFTLVIDGFLVSPNVQVLDVGAESLGFEHSDHNPVFARLRAR